MARNLADGRPVEWDLEVAESPGLAEDLETLRLIEGVSKLFGETGDTQAIPVPQEDPRGIVRQLDAALSDRYNLGRVLGEGGTATVFMVEDVKHHRPLAIKVFKLGIIGSITADRFLKEIQIAARLQHPHILPLFDSGCVGELLYYIMPFADGDSLRDLLDRERQLPLESALRIACEVADALHYAHARRIIHRDIKPGNIMLQGGHAVVADFGIARAIDVAGSPGATAPGWVLGTPGYMSPEQVTGLGEVDARSDVFSLGCVLFEMLGGVRPFENSLEHVLTSSPGIDPRTSLARLRPGLPRPVLLAIQRALARNPADRFDTAAEFAAALLPPVTQEFPAPPEARTTETPNNLPAQLTSFVGRGAQIADCIEFSRGTRLLTLTGAGGSGKTRLALRLAEELLEEARDGVWLADLSPLRSGDQVAVAVAAALGVREAHGRTMAESLAAELGERRVAVILDNIEHLLGSSADLVDTLLRLCPRVRFIATSREPMGVGGERVYAVPPLGLPDPNGPMDVGSVAHSEAGRLFADRASFARPGFKLTSENAPTVAEICRRLDGLPFAIELAAARVRHLGTDEILSRLKHSFRLLTGAGGPSTVSRHQTLRATMDWSHEHLDVAERALFRALSVFAGGWTLEAAVALAGADQDEFEVLDLLAHLVDKSLVVVDRAGSGKSRYRYLETVRQYALEHLEQAGLGAAARGRHLAFYTSLAEWGEEKIQAGQDAAVLTELGQEQGNFLAALEWSDTGADEPAKMLRLAGALGRYWYVRGEFAIGRRALDGALAKNQSGADVRALAKAVYGTAAMALFQGDAAAARPRLEQYLELCKLLADHNGIAIAHNGLGLAATRAGEHDLARRHLDLSLEFYRGGGDHEGISKVLHNLGVVALSRGDEAEALRCMERALDHDEGAVSGHQTALTLAFQAMLLVNMSRPAAARALLITGFRLVRALGAKRQGAHMFEAAAQHAACSDVRFGVRLLGIAMALREAIASPLWPAEQALLDQFAAGVRARLGRAEYDRIVAAARQPSFDATVEEALAWLESQSLQTGP